MDTACRREFTSAELRGGAAVCVIGETVRAKLFGASANVIGSRLRLQNLSFQIVGLLSVKGQSTMGLDQDDQVIVPLHAFQRRIAGNQDVSILQASVRGGKATSRASADIERLLRERRHLSHDQEDDFTVRDMTEIADMFAGTARVLTALLGSVAAVSLFVGGVGIMNIMLVSVTERTREIGIRLAIGALESDVMLQFLVEAMVLSLFGGLLGIGIAMGASALLARVLTVPWVPSAGIIIGAFAFSGAIGVLFGFFPARKAAHLNPIEALRHE